MNKLIIHLLKYWNGHLKLIHSFLHVYLPLTVIWMVIKQIIKGATDIDQSGSIIVVGGAIVVGFAVAIYKCIGLWRCANNTNKAFYKYLARVVAVTPLLFSTVGILLIFVADLVL
jgi:hypothetical protein